MMLIIILIQVISHDHGDDVMNKISDDFVDEEIVRLLVIMNTMKGGSNKNYKDIR